MNDREFWIAVRAALLSTQHEDAVYGTMRGEATLKDLIGGG